jgi:hypothetical protein
MLRIGNTLYFPGLRMLRIGNTSYLCGPMMVLS